MDKRKLLHIILWVVAVVCFGMTIWDYYAWIERGGLPGDSGKSHWIYWILGGVICIAIWFFTREEEEEVSITRAN